MAWRRWIEESSLSVAGSTKILCVPVSIGTTLQSTGIGIPQRTVFLYIAFGSVAPVPSPLRGGLGFILLESQAILLPLARTVQILLPLASSLFRLGGSDRRQRQNACCGK
ncbi:MAG: hypothetical protein JW828_12940 [Sedimentisphaerales bacterium]|nr:hypothetical protein [Sedimentisphaerales bacterium]